MFLWPPVSFPRVFTLYEKTASTVSTALPEASPTIERKVVGLALLRGADEVLIFSLMAKVPVDPVTISLDVLFALDKPKERPAPFRSRTNTADRFCSNASVEGATGKKRKMTGARPVVREACL